MNSRWKWHLYLFGLKGHTYRSTVIGLQFNLAVCINGGKKLHKVGKQLFNTQPMCKKQLTDTLSDFSDQLPTKQQDGNRVGIALFINLKLKLCLWCLTSAILPDYIGFNVTTVCVLNLISKMKFGAEVQMSGYISLLAQGNNPLIYQEKSQSTCSKLR